MKKLVIIGAGGHGKVVSDIAEKNGYEEIVFLDDDRNLKECTGFPVVGKSNEIERYKSWEFFVAIGDANIRHQIQNKIAMQHFCLATLIHPQAIVNKRASIGKGTVVMAGAVINPDVVIGRGCIVNTGASIDHDCVLKDYVHLAVGAHLTGNIHISEKTWVGAGAIICNNAKICQGCMIGAGAVVIKDIHKSGTYVGVPARCIK